MAELERVPEEVALGGLALESSLANKGEDKLEGVEVFLIGLGKEDDVI